MSTHFDALETSRPIMKRFLLLALFAAGAHAQQLAPMYAAIVPPAEHAAKKVPGPLTCLHNPYFNVCGGMARKYETRALVAVWDGEKLTQQQRGPVVNTIEENTAVYRCSSYPGVEFFGEQYAVGSAPTNARIFIGDSVWTAPDGRQYIGEGFGMNRSLVQVLSAGEPILTMNPVAGETLTTEYRQSTTGCGGPMKPFSGIPFTTWYKTIEHLDTFTDAAGQVWTDVWRTSLAEWTLAPGLQRYYSYWFARGPGLVQQEAWTAAPLPVSINYTWTLIGEAR